MSPPKVRSMRWTERQRAMLREMGITLWAPAEGQAPDSVEASRPAEPAHAVDATPRSSGDAGEVGVREGNVTHAAGDGARRLPGLADADWLVVAEPLDAADPQQEQLLDNMLRAIGVGLLAPNRERRAVFSPLLLAPGSSAASAAAGASTENALAAAIAAVAPRCILAFGRAAAAALLGDDAPIGGLRGRVHRLGGVPVVVTFSLPFLLRHPAEKAKAWADLCLAVATVTAAANVG
jgi:DNA polymerase